MGCVEKTTPYSANNLAIRYFEVTYSRPGANEYYWKTIGVLSLLPLTLS